MNTVQQIILMLLKSMHFNLFENNLTAEEDAFLRKLKTHHWLKSLVIKVEADGKFVLMWDSQTEETVACWIDDRGFYFSSIGIYNKEKNRMEKPVSSFFHNGSIKANILDQEIDVIKTIFLTYSIDVNVYFK